MGWSFFVCHLFDFAKDALGFAHWEGCTLCGGPFYLGDGAGVHSVVLAERDADGVVDIHRDFGDVPEGMVAMRWQHLAEAVFF